MRHSRCSAKLLCILQYILYHCYTISFTNYHYNHHKHDHRRHHCLWHTESSSIYDCTISLWNIINLLLFPSLCGLCFAKLLFCTVRLHVHVSDIIMF